MSSTSVLESTLFTLDSFTDVAKNPQLQVLEDQKTKQARCWRTGEMGGGVQASCKNEGVREARMQ